MTVAHRQNTRGERYDNKRAESNADKRVERDDTE